jgi:hypothetical protein
MIFYNKYRRRIEVAMVKLKMQIADYERLINENEELLIVYEYYDKIFALKEQIALLKSLL